MPHLLGISLEVYFIILVISLPVFFIWRWLLTRRGLKEKSSLYATLATIVTAPIVYVGIIFCWIAISFYYPDREFDKETWRQDTEKRYEYTQSLKEGRLLEGMTEEQVLEYLGEPSYKEKDTYIYYIGYKPAIIGIDPDWLKIKFKDGIFSELSEYNS